MWTTWSPRSAGRSELNHLIYIASSSSCSSSSSSRLLSMNVLLLLLPIEVVIVVIVASICEEEETCNAVSSGSGDGKRLITGQEKWIGSSVWWYRKWNEWRCPQRVRRWLKVMVYFSSRGTEWGRETNFRSWNPNVHTNNKRWLSWTGTKKRILNEEVEWEMRWRRSGSNFSFSRNSIGTFGRRIQFSSWSPFLNCFSFNLRWRKLFWYSWENLSQFSRRRFDLILLPIVNPSVC